MFNGWPAHVQARPSEPSRCRSSIPRYDETWGLWGFCSSVRRHSASASATRPARYSASPRLARAAAKDGLALYPAIRDGLSPWADKFGVAPPKANS